MRKTGQSVPEAALNLRLAHVTLRMPQRFFMTAQEIDIQAEKGLRSIRRKALQTEAEVVVPSAEDTEFRNDDTNSHPLARTYNH